MVKCVLRTVDLALFVPSHFPTPCKGPGQKREQDECDDAKDGACDERRGVGVSRATTSCELVIHVHGVG